MTNKNTLRLLTHNWMVTEMAGTILGRLIGIWNVHVR